MLWADKWCESILPTRGSQGTSALWLNLPLTQFPLRPVCESCDLFFKSKGNNQSLPVFLRNLTCFRPCWEAAGSHSPIHHVLTPRPPWLHQSRPPALEGFSQNRGPEKEEPSYHSWDILPSMLLLQNGSWGIAVGQGTAVEWCHQLG